MFKKNLEGKITKVDDQLGNSINRPHLIIKDKLEDEVDIAPITKSTNYNNNLEIKTNPPLKNEPSYLVLEHSRAIDRCKAEANLTGQTATNRNELFNKIAKRKEHEL